MSDPIKEKVSRQSVAAAELIAALRSDDDQLNHDMVEGETDFFEAVEAALDKVREYQTHIVGIDGTMKGLSDRKARMEKRVSSLRGLIDQAFQLAGVSSHTFACETVSIKRVPPKLVITDESQIPSKFFKPQPPKLDRKELLEAAKGGEVLGAHMSNGGQTIQIRSS